MVKVIIERHCRPNREAELEKVLMELRSGGMYQHGYYSGETLQSVNDPTLWLVISTWTDADTWKAWENSPERQKIASKLEPLLVESEKVSIFSSVK